MGDKVVWFEDCPSCGAKGSLECFEHDSAELKLDSCDKCGFIQSYEYTEKKGVIHVEKVTNSITSEKLTKILDKYRANMFDYYKSEAYLDGIGYPMDWDTEAQQEILLLFSELCDGLAVEIYAVEIENKLVNQILQAVPLDTIKKELK